MCTLFIACCFYSTAPSTSPEMVNAHTVSSSTIYVYWGEVTCQLHNGEITGYFVEYSRRGGGGEGSGEGGSGCAEVVHVTSPNLTITGLGPLTEYIIRVAAVNKNGAGPFSDPVYVTTYGSVLQSGMSLTPTNHSVVITIVPTL